MEDCAAKAVDLITTALSMDSTGYVEGAKGKHNPLTTNLFMKIHTETFLSTHLF
jgi:hypothetical protein